MITYFAFCVAFCRSLFVLLSLYNFTIVLSAFQSGLGRFKKKLYIFSPWQGKEPHSHPCVNPKSRTGNSPFIRAILEQRSCSGNFPYYLLGGKGFIKYKSGPVYKSCPLLKKIAHTHKQQNKKPRVIIFYLNHDAC